MRLYSLATQPSRACGRQRLRQPVLTASASCNGSEANRSGTNMNRKKKAIYSWPEARKKARSMGLRTRQEFEEYDCPGSYGVPKNPQVVYHDSWAGWDDFLGVPYSFEEARAKARDLKCAYVCSTVNKGVDCRHSYFLTELCIIIFIQLVFNSAGRTRNENAPKKDMSNPTRL
eukprot:scaffold169538_cov30-Prasinocladus_malaysianus.AAC.1